MTKNQNNQSLSCRKFAFRQWSRKSYAVFTSLQKVVKICTLNVAIGMVVMPVQTTAQQDTARIAKKIDMDELVVSAQRTPAVYSKVARVVHVISRDEIAKAPVQSIDGLLEFALNLDMRQRGGNGVQADVSVRGGSFDQTLILLNGVNISDPQTGHHSMNLPVDLESIERVEILEGPGARVFGPNAFSGAINIITNKAGEDNHAEIHAMAGEHGLYKTAVSAGVTTGKFTHFVAGGRQASDGYIDNTDYGINNAYYHGNLSTKKGMLDFQAGYTEKEFGANSFYTPAFPNQFEATRTLFSSVKFSGGNKLKYTPTVYWRRNHDRFELFRDNAPEWYKSHNYHQTDVLGGGLNLSYVSNLGKSALGLEYRNERILSNVLGEELSSPKEVPGYDDVFFTKSHDRNNVSLYLEHTIYLGRFTASAGAMANWNEDLEDNPGIYPGMDVSYALTEELSAFGSVNRSLRLPTYTDLYYVGPTNLGNPDLKPEEAITAEGGLKYHRKGVSAHASVFKRYGKNIIDWVKEKEEDKWQSQNLTEINSFGVELSGTLHPALLLDAEIPVKMLRLGYAYLELDKESQDLLSRYVLDNLKHKFTLSMDTRIYKNLGLYVQASWQDRNGGYIEYSDGVWGQEVEYKPFWLMDSKLYWDAGKWSVFVAASNVFDAYYYDLGNVGQPGRWIKGGLSYRFEF